MWIFEVKDDGTFKNRFVGRGDLMREGVHYEASETFCGNVKPIKIALKVAANHVL